MQAREEDYSFGRFYLDTRERILLCDGRAVSITLKAFHTLFVLVQSSGHIVEKGELMKQVWPNAFVEESNLTQHIYKLRKLLGVRADGRQYIETVPRRGYRFTAAPSESMREEDDNLTMQHHVEKITSIPEDDEPTSLQTTTISLAIMPYVYAGADTDAQYHSDCITKSLTRILSGLPELRIMSSNIVFALQE